MKGDDRIAMKVTVPHRDIGLLEGNLGPRLYFTYLSGHGALDYTFVQFGKVFCKPVIVILQIRLWIMCWKADHNEICS